MKRSKIVGVGLMLLAVGFYFFTYWNRGGFNKTVISQREHTHVVLNGLMYEGYINTPQFGSYFDAVESAISVSQNKGHVCAYYYKSPGSNNDRKVNVFVGALLDDKSVVLSDSFRQERFTLGKSLHAEQEANLMVSSVYDDLYTYADENQILLDSNVVFEQYVHDKLMIVDIPIRE